MKSKIKINPVIITGMLVLILCMNNGYSQEKPKGKPWPAPESALKLKNPVPVNAENLAEGKTLYVKHCKSCHGTKGKGDGLKAANLDISCGDFSTIEFQRESEGEMYWKTTEGRDPMPSFKKKTTDEERWMIINYIRTLGEEKK